MPTGFDVETGSALSPRLQPIAHKLASFLQATRARGDVTPDKPMPSWKIRERSLASGYKLAGSDICAMVNYLRRNGYPIASTKYGYFWANSIGELETTIKHMAERIASMQDAVEGMKQRFTSKQIDLPFHT